MAVLAVLSICLSCLCLSTATDSAGSEMDLFSNVLTDQDMATNMAVNQLAILSILSDSSKPEQASLQQCKNESLQAANETLEALINRYEIKLDQTGQAVLQQCRNETRAVSETIEARINQYENQLDQTGQAVLHQCMNETQAASETMEARIKQYEIQLDHTEQAVVQQWNETQAASEALEARINQNKIQLTQTRQAVLQQCRKETQAVSERLQAQINLYEIQLDQTGQAVVQQGNENQAASEALEVRMNQNEIQLNQTRQAVVQQGNEIQAASTLEARIIQNEIQHNQARQEVFQQTQLMIQQATTILQAQINQIEDQLTQSYTNIVGTSSCSGTKVLHGISGMLELSSAMYTNHKDCSWDIVAPEGSVLDIQWFGFQLQNCTACVCDWVKVVDLNRPNELIYGQKLCGSPGFLNTSSLMTNTNKLKVTFHSDGSETFNGFKMWFQALQIPYDSTTWNNVGTSHCSGTKELRGTTGTLELTSGNYTNSMDCEWKVIAPEGSVLAIQWLRFNTEGGYDWVKVVDLHRPTDLIYGTRLNGSLGFFNTSSWMVSSNLMTVTFHSDGSNTRDGFKLRFQALQIPYSFHQQTSLSTCSGNKVVEGTLGQLALTSYTHNRDCSWLVKTPPGSVVTLRWLKFSLEDHRSCNYDWVKVTDLNRPSSLVYGKKLCGTSQILVDRALTVSSNRIHIAFHSDGSNVGDGFRLEYQALQVPTNSHY